jgi:hypothetical protein
MPAKAPEHPLATVILKVCHRKYARRGDYLVEVFTQEELSKEPFLCSVGPVSTAQSSHEQGTKQGETGKVGGSIAA